MRGKSRVETLASKETFESATSATKNQNSKVLWPFVLTKLRGEMRMRERKIASDVQEREVKLHQNGVTNLFHG